MTDKKIIERVRKHTAELLWTKGKLYTRFFPFSALKRIEKKSPYWKGTRQNYLEFADKILSHPNIAIVERGETQCPECGTRYFAINRGD